MKLSRILARPLAAALAISLCTPVSAQSASAAEPTKEEKLAKERHDEWIAAQKARCGAESLDSVPGKEWMDSYGWRYATTAEARAAYVDLVKNTPPWPTYMLPSVARLEPGRRFQMAFSKGQTNQQPGGFGTFDKIDSVEEVRQDLAVLFTWKEDVDRVVTFEITKPTLVLVGPIGPQVDPVKCKLLHGRFSQFQLLMPPAQRKDYMKVISEVKLAQPLTGPNGQPTS
ncbi:hypothetical protein QWY75_04435 [Pontixanthobacter aestiaquae]|uniref:Uncharacterized protein n=1 Tax=Pontixanthobacter aestiaquae TaxID=1509367 RepID=A0A844Z7Q4_9SPHN|nr:hypothetical protein [Pontixanthobacter aestiaquae]MDN3645456.1 hypothetical protein [Pontixanthobacter aestiaquae]MXO83544.1 hypothetical protein [Pontixanthobacter aestiaquae]